jgi:hypothetical protein
VPRIAGPAVFAFAGLLVIVMRGPQSLCQTNEPVKKTSDASAAKSLLDAFEAEEKLGAYIFYSQSFIDKENKKASYRGSIYGSIQRFHVAGCELKLDIALQDYFSGTVGKNQTGRLLDSYLYSVTFTLTRAIADSLTLSEARPIQLGGKTNSICPEKPSCSFTWLTVHADRPVIRESTMTNGILNFNGRTDHFQAPLSSGEAGEELIRKMRELAEAQCR